MNHGMKGHSPLRKTLTGFNTQHPWMRHIKDHYLREYRQHSKTSHLSKNSVRTDRGRWLWLLSSWVQHYGKKTKQVYSYPKGLGQCWPIWLICMQLRNYNTRAKIKKLLKDVSLSVVANGMHRVIYGQSRKQEKTPLVGIHDPLKYEHSFLLMYSFSCERIHFKRSLKVFNWLLNFKRAMRERREKLILPQWNLYIPDLTRHWKRILREHNYPTGKLPRDWYLVQQATYIDLRKKNLSLCCMEKQPITMYFV